jgi:hypothetical protein
MKTENTPEPNEKQLMDAQHEAWCYLHDARTAYEKDRTLAKADALLIRATNLLLAISEVDEYRRELNGWRP